jgi:hypothetical protein
MVGSMNVWELIAAVILIIATPLALVFADFGSTMLATLRRRRHRARRGSTL